MKSLKKASVAIVGGTGFDRLFKDTVGIHMGTPYGIPPPVKIKSVNNRNVAFLPRHGQNHSVPPHKIKYRANISALHELGAERVIATNSVGAIDINLQPGDVVIPHDFIDFTRRRHVTFYDKDPVTHIDLSQPYCPEMRGVLIETAGKLGVPVRKEAVLVCTEGPRLETPAEIAMFRRLGCDVVGMTSLPEVVLAKELGMCYASVCYVSNMAAGLQESLTVQEVADASKKIVAVLEEILIAAIKTLPSERNCQCMRTLKDARLE